ncbi:probable RNA-binding protein 19 isoform X2 [Orussus abietinus]|uniref:probable RNA-binding protein 19 isoform X2 n=1 Tax=Orussus abietinus TaxID=222816 RepID=UPI000626071E|nr:probable RNA-binding protein 19 isoform X2 [Orussus abietinus]
MSRLIVKNLPKKVSEDRLRQLFSEKGVVTDVQLKYTAEGKFRRFCFVGYKTEHEAQAALEYFDKTCIDTSKISVELCSGLGDASKPKSWSKYAPDSSAHKAIVKEEKSVEEVTEEPTTQKKKKKKKKEKDSIIEALEKHKDDPLFAEFIESHTGKNAVWSNDTSILEKNVGDGEKTSDKEDYSEDEDSAETEKDQKDEEEKIANKKMTDLEYMEALKEKKTPQGAKPKSSVEDKKSKHGPQKFFTVKLRGLGFNHRKGDVKKFFKPLKAKSIRVPQEIRGIAYVGFKNEMQMKKALNKDKSFLDGKRIFVTAYHEKEKTQDSDYGSNNRGTQNLKWKEQEEALNGEESIAESGRLFIRNLSYAITEDDIRSLFEKYGPLAEVNLPVDKVTRKLKAFGTVTFLMPEHAVKAYTELDGSIFHGRMLHILPGKAKSDDLAEQDGLSYKDKKDLKDKATANSTHNWNTLFLGQNAVADAIAARYNTTKEKVLEDGGKKGTSVAVRLALGETQLVEDTRKFLEENGVHLDAFNQSASKRSKTVILIKNLPVNTEKQEIREKFVRFGELGRVVMPPMGVTALVEFLEPSEARKAFTGLAYTKFKHLPLYLEWAPEDSFSTAPSESRKKDKEERGKGKSAETKETIKEKIEEPEKLENGKEEEEDVEEEEEPENDTTLFVKNLNFSTTEEALKKHFNKCGKLHYISIATKKDPKNPGAKLSMGYGFIRYKRKADTDRALKDLQTSTLDGKTLELKRSERTLQSDLKTAKKSTKMTPQTGTKIMVRNVPFQANANEIQELFKAFGELKAVRLPKKMVGEENHRGFAFVEYYSKSDAKRAFKALCQSTHLYGRRLVLEWAQTEENVEDLRKRTAKHFHQEPSAKRSKKSTLDPEAVGLEVA